MIIFTTVSNGLNAMTAGDNSYIFDAVKWDLQTGDDSKLFEQFVVCSNTVPKTFSHADDGIWLA
jgi:hypothetical protein